MILRIAIAAYLIGLLVFYMQGLFHIPVWAWSYYLWDKAAGGSMLSWAVIYKSSFEKELIAPVLLFSIIRLLWEAISAGIGVNVSNQWIVALLFIVLVVIIGYLCFHPKSQMVKFLVKQLF